MRAEKAVSIQDFKAAARRRLPRLVFDYFEGGVEDELCLARNRAALEAVELTPRYLRDVTTINQGVELFARL